MSKIINNMMLWLTLRPKVMKELIAWIRMRPKLLGEAKGEELTPKQQELVRKWIERMSKVMGVPPEAIDEEIAKRWVIGWMKAFIKEEYWEQVGLK
jgi:hypothetical protein